MSVNLCNVKSIEISGLNERKVILTTNEELVTTDKLTIITGYDARIENELKPATITGSNRRRHRHSAVSQPS